MKITIYVKDGKMISEEKALDIKKAFGSVEEYNITISTSNSKLGGFIPTINQPPKITCCECKCREKCYACKGNFRFANVQMSMQNNLEFYNKYSDLYFNAINDFISNGLTIYKYFRYHSSGDIVNYNYLLKMVELAKNNPITTFLCFTKKFDFVNRYIKENGELPQNLTIVFSAWDKTFKVNNPYNLPIAYVDFKKKSENPTLPTDYIECENDCEKCLKCWHLRKGESVIFKEH